MAYGLLPTGFAAKPLAACKGELEDLVRARFGAGVNLAPEGPWGQFIGILSERESLLWDLAQAVYVSRDPGQATGAAQDAICAITGVSRTAGTRSTVMVLLTGTPGTSLLAGRIVSAQGDRTARFVLQSNTAITGEGTVLAEFAAEAVGPVRSPAGALTVIETPVAGWTGATNPLDAVAGSYAESDSALRLRRAASFGGAGDATTAAIATRVRRVTGVSAVEVFWNDSGTTDSDGIPPHAAEVLVSGGADADVAAAIWAAKPVGIALAGATSITVTDVAGREQAVRFSRPIGQPIYLAVTVAKDSAYPTDGDDQIKAALATWGALHLATGADVYPRALIPTVMAIAGVYDVPSLYVGLSASPTSEAPLIFAPRERAEVDAARITVAYR